MMFPRWSILLVLVVSLAPRCVAQTDPPTNAARTTAIYDVRDLVRETSVPPADPAASLGRTADPSADDDTEARIRVLVQQFEDDLRRKFARELAIKDWATLLRTMADPSLEQGEALEAAGEGSLVLTGRAVHHDWLRSILTMQRQNPDMVEIAFRILSGPKGTFTDQGLELTTTYADDGQLHATLAKLKVAGVDALSAPRILTRSLEESSLSVLSQTSYVKEFHVHYVEPKQQMIADPVVDVINEGLLCQARVVLLPDGRIGIQTEVNNTKIRRPIATRKVRIAPGSDLEGEISSPELSKAHFSASARLADGASASFLSTLDDQTDLALFVTLKRVPRIDEGSRPK